jgi:hypothetical protein
LEKPHGKFTAARAILAFANRSPKVAAHACEGVAYVIVGAEPRMSRVSCVSTTHPSARS